MALVPIGSILLNPWLIMMMQWRPRDTIECMMGVTILFVARAVVDRIFVCIMVLAADPARRTEIENGTDEQVHGTKGIIVASMGL